MHTLSSTENLLDVTKPRPWKLSGRFFSCLFLHISLADRAEILRSAGFTAQGKETAIAQWKQKLSLLYRIFFQKLNSFYLPLVSRAGFFCCFHWKIGTWNERWQNMLPKSITVSLLELADNSWQVIYIALLLILPFISSVVNLLEVFLIRVVFANHMVYFY